MSNTLPFITTPVSSAKPIIAWWSGGADSAITCWYSLQWFGKDCVRVIFIDTKNENEDTYRFKADCEKWWGITIETITSKKWENIEEVWEHYLSLNTAHGAICSTELKRMVRQDFQMRNSFSCQAFGFDADESNRAIALKKNHPDSFPVYPLIYELLKKGDSIRILQKNGIAPPAAYQKGYRNNNCWQTGCVKGGIGYWQKIRDEEPEKFEKMAAREHRYTDLKGEPVTILKDQSKGGGLVFLKPHQNYPNMKDLSMMKGRKPEALMECNGFCGTKK